MTSHPPDWKNRLLRYMNIPFTPEAMAVLTSWAQSTPLSSLANNPLGIPAATAKSPRFSGTDYAAFRSISGFYTAFQKFIKTPAGKDLIHAITSDVPYPAAWRVISDLKWPASKTETDYPAKLLDLTEQSYRDSVNATPKADRKTSGKVGASLEIHQAIIGQARSMAQAANAMSHTQQAVHHLIRKHARNG